MKIIGFETRGFTVHQVHSQICLLKWYLCIVLLIWVWISVTVFFPARTESSCFLTQLFPAELWNTGQPQALVAGGHTSGHPTLKTTALNAACFVPVIWPTLAPSVGTGSRGYTVQTPAKQGINSSDRSSQTEPFPQGYIGVALKCSTMVNTFVGKTARAADLQLFVKPVLPFTKHMMSCLYGIRVRENIPSTQTLH